MTLAVIILAGGQSSRMNSKTSKLLHKIAAKPIINYSLDVAEQLKCEQLVVVISPESNELEANIKQYSKKCNIAIQPIQNGTGGAVIAALDKLSPCTDVVIIYGDTPFIKAQTITSMINNLLNYQLIMLGFENSDIENHYGRLITDDKKLLSIVEYKNANESQRAIEMCNAGFMAIKHQVLQDLISKVECNTLTNEIYLTDLVKLANLHNYQASYVTADHDEVIGVNNRTELATAEAIMQQNLRQELLQSGVTMIDSSSVTLSYDTVIGNDCVIHPYVVFGPGVNIAQDVEIKSFSHIEQATIERQAVIGPYARIRPGSHIEEECHIGNFVEIKNSLIGKKSKINHLSYVGDSSIGTSCNIGAGTITCNYDGINKHRTEIGDNVLVGSNCSLIAPVLLNSDSYIAAGSVITHNVPRKALAIGRARQINKENMANLKLKPKTS